MDINNSDGHKCLCQFSGFNCDFSFFHPENAFQSTQIKSFSTEPPSGWGVSLNPRLNSLPEIVPMSNFILDDKRWGRQIVIIPGMANLAIRHWVSLLFWLGLAQ